MGLCHCSSFGLSPEDSAMGNLLSCCSVTGTSLSKHTLVTVTSTAPPGFKSAIFSSTSFILIFITWLLQLMSLPFPALLAKNTSSVCGLYIGASCAYGKLLLDETW